MKGAKERINKAVAFLKGNQIIKFQNDIVRAMDADKNTVSQALKGNEKYLTESFIKRFSDVFPCVDCEWILSGKGEMLKPDTSVSNSTPVISTGRVIPYYDAEVAAGTNYGMEMTQARPSGMIEIGGLMKDSEFALRVYGNSMTPNYPAGCVIGLKQHTDSFIEPGTVYVVETTDNRYLKRLYYTKGKDAFRCISDNTMKHENGPMTGEYFYQEFEIPLKDVARLLRVTGVIKRNIL